MINIALDIVIIVLFGIDQLLKYLAIKYLSDIETYGIINNILYLTLVKNKGAAFGIFKNHHLILTTLTAVMLFVGLVFFNFYNGFDNIKKIGFLLMLSGGIGNFIDRFYRGFVIDYIDIRIINFAVFNFADCCICVGCLCIIYSTIALAIIKK